MTSSFSLEKKQHLIRQATLASVVASSFIIGGKMMAWWLTDSVSLLASLVDSILDIGVSVINFLAVRYAMQPPDEEHRFGHGKAEDLAAFAQASIIMLSGIFVAYQAIERFFIPQTTEHTVFGVSVMIFSTIIVVALVLFQKSVARKTSSPVVLADSLHYMNDILINATVVVSLIAVQFFGIIWIDSLFGLAIAIYIALGAWNIGVKSFHELMDREFNDRDRERIKELITNHPSVKGWHRLKTRSSGGKPFIQFDLELDGDITLREAHSIADKIEEWIVKEFPDAEVIIHQDPV